jgi:hypothetical protein
MLCTTQYNNNGPFLVLVFDEELVKLLSLVLQLVVVILFNCILVGDRVVLRTSLSTTKKKRTCVARNCLNDISIGPAILAFGSSGSDCRLGITGSYVSSPQSRTRFAGGGRSYIGAWYGRFGGPL